MFTDFIFYVLFFGVLTTFFMVSAMPHVKCDKMHKKIGCFNKPTSAMELLINDRIVGGPKNKGHLLDWYNFGKFLHR